MNKALYRNRNFMLLWSGQMVSSLGAGVTRIIYPLLILSLTNSPAKAGLASALILLPYLLFGLPAGALVDRWDRKRVMIFCDLCRALAIVSIPIAIACNVLTVAQIYCTAFVEGTLFLFFSLAEVAALPRVVAKHQIAAALAQNEAGYTTTHIMAPSIGTWLYNVSHALPFSFHALSHLASAYSLFFVRSNLQSEASQRQRLWVEVREGMTWLWQHRLLRFMAFLTGGLSFANGSTQLLLIVLAKQFGASEAEIGLMFSVSAMGGIFGAAIGSRIRKHFQFSQIIIATSCMITLFFPLYGLAPNIILLTLISLCAHIVGPIYNIVQYSHRIELIPDKLQGRGNAAYRMIAMGAFPLGSALVGVLIERFGTGVAIACFAVWQLGFALSAVLSQQLKQSNRAAQPQTAPTPN